MFTVKSTNKMKMKKKRFLERGEKDCGREEAPPPAANFGLSLMSPDAETSQWWKQRTAERC